MQAEFRRSSGPPASYDLYLFYDIEGLYLRKWGLHQPRALGFWATPRDVGRLALPHTPLVGSAVYVPRVRFELPSFLPDLGFQDLRLIEVPQPILSLRYLQSQSYSDWMARRAAWFQGLGESRPDPTRSAPALSGSVKRPVLPAVARKAPLR